MSADTSQAFFESLYRNDEDPWDFASSDYEQNRYAAIMRTLRGDETQRYQRAFEPGCSVGILTSRLASICDEVVAVDISPTAVLRAREHCRYLNNVNISAGALPQSMPDGSFDLIVFSEIGYYFEEPELTAIAHLLVSRLREGGQLLAAHWLGRSEDHVLSGDRVHQILDGLGILLRGKSERQPGFRLNSWYRA